VCIGASSAIRRDDEEDPRAFACVARKAGATRVSSSGWAKIATSVRGAVSALGATVVRGAQPAKEQDRQSGYQTPRVPWQTVDHAFHQ